MKVEYIVPPLPPQPPGEFRLTLSEAEARVIFRVFNTVDVCEAVRRDPNGFDPRVIRRALTTAGLNEHSHYPSIGKSRFA